MQLSYWIWRYVHLFVYNFFFVQLFIYILIFYLGPLCQNIVKDDCGILNNPCVHGRCRGGPNSYQCDCHPGYGGYRCDRPINGMFLREIIFTKFFLKLISRKNFVYMVIFRSSSVCLRFFVNCLLTYFRVFGQSMSKPGDLCRSSRRLRVSVFAWNLGQKLRT